MKSTRIRTQELDAFKPAAVKFAIGNDGAINTVNADSGPVQYRLSMWRGFYGFAQKIHSYARCREQIDFLLFQGCR